MTSNQFNSANHNDGSIKKVFIVGCPRSGTTLLQGILSSNPTIYSLPETFFFAKVLSRNFIKRHLMWPALKVRSQLSQTVIDLNRPDLLSIAKIGLFQRDYHVPFLKVMDRLTQDDNKTVWVEKTPMHLYCVDEIQERIPDALIIHLVRNGKDVVASLVNATTKNPAKWAKFGKGKKWKNWKGFTYQEAALRWNKDYQITKSKLHSPNNVMIKYEDIITNPFNISNYLCSLIDIPFHTNMTNPSASFNQIVNADEPWKQNNSNAIGARENLYDKMFTAEEKEEIESILLPYEI